MTEPRLDYVSCVSPRGLHRMAYWEWGDPDNSRVLLCVHGLTRTGRDFDALARRLSSHYRVVCPDVVGRGRSGWLADPAGYGVPQYVADMVTLLARVRAQTLHWFGTSMGGLIGMTLAGMPGASGDTPVVLDGSHEAQARTPSLTPAPISRIVLNDVGPHLSPEALARIGTYVGDATRFDTFDQAVDYTRSVSSSFGPHTEQQWRELTLHTVRRCEGGWVKHYDLGLAAPFATITPDMAALGEAMLWHAYAAIACPILVVRGEQSDLLSLDTAQAMLAANPRATLAQVAGVGHAPTFLDDAQIALAEEFLLA